MNNNSVILSPVGARISTIEIAKITGKRHEHVARDAKAMLLKLNIDPSGLKETYVDTCNRTQTKLMLSRSQAATLVSGYSVEIRAAIMERVTDSAIIEAMNDFEVPEDLHDMYVYAIRESESGRIKLGISRNPEQRLKQLQTGNSQVLELVAFKKAKNGFSDEKAAHEIASSHHVRGEWFDGGVAAIGSDSETIKAIDS